MSSTFKNEMIGVTRTAYSKIIKMENINKWAKNLALEYTGIYRHQLYTEGMDPDTKYQLRVICEVSLEHILGDYADLT